MEEKYLRIIRCLADGMTREETSEYLKVKGFAPSSIRSIEDLINRLKKEYRVKTVFKLALVLKAKNII